MNLTLKKFASSRKGNALRWVWLLFLAVLGLSLGASAQQPVAANGSGTNNTSDAAWTSATGGNTAVSLVSNTQTYNTVLVTLVQGTTITGGVVTFEQSIDNSTWTTVQGVTLGATTIMGPTYTLVASTNVSFLFPVNAPYFRVRLSTVITGSGTVTIQHATQTFPGAALLAGTETLAAGANIIGKVTTDQTTHGTTDLVAADLTKIAGTAASNTTAGVLDVNVKNVANAAPPIGNGTSAVAQRVTLSSDSTGQVSIAGSVTDPCQAQARSSAVINLTASGQIITGTAAKQTYICFVQFSLSAVADNIALVEGTGTVCATGIAGMAGGTTAATGWNLLGNGSVTAGRMLAWGFKTATLADNVCLLASSAAQISGVVQFVQQ